MFTRPVFKNVLKVINTSEGHSMIGGNEFELQLEKSTWGSPGEESHPDLANPQSPSTVQIQPGTLQERPSLHSGLGAADMH